MEGARPGACLTSAFPCRSHGDAPSKAQPRRTRWRLNVSGDPHSDSPERLLGRWRLLRADAALTFAPDVLMEFRTGGRLLYEFSAGGKRHLVRLLYRVDGDGETMHTDNPDAPHELVTHFHFGAGGALVFDFAGARAWFVREI
jgi:hypothetical protein